MSHVMTYMTAPMKATDEMPLSIPVCMKRSTSSAEDSAASTPAMPKKPENLPDGVEHEEEYDRQECLMIGKAVADGDWRVKVQTSGQQ